MFYNLFFLLVACSQFIPALRVGFFWTYFGPLVFVLLISVSEEAMDDIARFKRDRRINLLAYTMLCGGGPEDTGEVRRVTVASRDIRVGEILILDSDDRVPVDCVLLRAIPAKRATMARLLTHRIKLQTLLIPFLSVPINSTVRRTGNCVDQWLCARRCQVMPMYCTVVVKCVQSP